MPNNVEAVAKRLSSRPYTVELMRDETTDGNEIWTAEHPELPRCLAQGRAPSQAVENLSDARFEYIRSLLEDGEPVPEPASQATSTGSTELPVNVVNSYVQFGPFGDSLMRPFDPEADEEAGDRPSKSVRKDLIESVTAEA